MAKIPISSYQPLPVIVEIGERIRSHYRPFRGLARWPDGSRRELVVKPQMDYPDSTIEHLFAEWCGYTIAEVIGLPTPRAHLVEIPQAILTPLSGDCADILPGVAFATEEQRPYFQCGEMGFPRAEAIRNLESVAGMVVLDTILGNNDRSDDVLAVAVPGTAKFELRYIDNTWVAYGREPTPDLIRGQFPRSWALKDLARGLAGLPPYLLAGKSLEVDVLTQAFLRAPDTFRLAAPDSCAAVAETFAWRGEHADIAIERTRPADL